MGRGVISVGKIDEIIEKLPEWLQPFADRYARVMAEKGFEDLKVIADSIIEGNWAQAYEYIVADMDTGDLTAELERINAGLEDLNKRNAENIEAQKEIVRQALTAVLAMFRADMGM